MARDDDFERVASMFMGALEEMGRIMLRRAADPDEDATDEEREESRRLAMQGIEIAHRWRHGGDGHA